MFKKIDFFNFFDKILIFEYEDMLIDYNLIQKIFYIISSLILQHCIIFTINKFNEYHLLSSIMIVDIIYFPFYCIERLVIERFRISNIISFFFNASTGIINLILLLIINEIIECNFWKLNINLKKNIIKRQKEDFYNLFDETEIEIVDNENNTGMELFNSL